MKKRDLVREVKQERAQFERELKEFLDLMEDSIYELHSLVQKEISKPETCIGVHADYPRESKSYSGFPLFHSSGVYSGTSPKDYVGVLRSKGGFLAALGWGFGAAEARLPKLGVLKNYLEKHDIGKRLIYTDYQGQPAFAGYIIDKLVGTAVERYLHKHGASAAIERKKISRTLAQTIKGIVSKSLNLTLVAPISLTHFDIDRYRLSDTTYLARIPKGIQLSRARMEPIGSGASKHVAQAATHAFVSTGWSIEVDDVTEVSKSLSVASENALDAVDSFLGALRVATGVTTGYAQIIWVPRRWALEYYCDLPPTYGAFVRQYPSDFDEYGWSRDCPRVSVEQIEEVRKIYGYVSRSNSESIRLAIRRLNSCLTRKDHSDAVVDATIGLEMLLGDDENQSLSYKLRLRTAALSWLGDNSTSAVELARKVNSVYSERSKIVHGHRSKRKKSAVDDGESRYTEARESAANILRFVLRILLEHPEYQVPINIDNNLILRDSEQK